MVRSVIAAVAGPADSPASRPDRDSEYERIRREHALLVESIQVAPIPFAVYDDQDRLIAWNRPYEQVHAQAFAKLRHLADRHELKYADLIRETARESVPADRMDAYVRQRVAAQRQADGVAVDRPYPGGGWYRISKFRTPGGAIAGFAIDISELKHREARLEEEIRRRCELEELLRLRMNTDALTGLSARAAFLERAESDFAHAAAGGDAMTAVMIDVDLFKQVNDVHGHGVGDRVLAGVAAAATDCLRQGLDLIGRIGGEEFAVRLLRTPLADGVSCAERIRSRIETLRFDGDAGPFSISASFGVAEREPSDASFAAMLARADRALYAAKRGGRNRVRAA
ncbi:MAG: GGDEF domain-containing protein [Lautropia sp.]